MLLARHTSYCSLSQLLVLELGCVHVWAVIAGRRAPNIKPLTPLYCFPSHLDKCKVSDAKDDSMFSPGADMAHFQH